ARWFASTRRCCEMTETYVRAVITAICRRTSSADSRATSTCSEACSHCTHRWGAISGTASWRLAVHESRGCTVRVTLATALVDGSTAVVTVVRSASTRV